MSDTTAMTVPQLASLPEEYIDDLIQKGDFSGLTMRDRSIFCYQLALRLGLNPLTKPFDFIVLNNKVTLYANKTAGDQLRKLHNISSEIIEEGALKLGDEVRPDTYRVKVRITDPSGRHEDALGLLGISNLKDEALGNAIMKCHTKALRRGTLAFCGLGFLDELEVQSAKGLEGSEGNPRQLQPPPIRPQENFSDEPNPLPKVEVTPMAAPPKVVSTRSLPQAGAPSSQPAAPKLPSVLPAVKP